MKASRDIYNNRDEFESVMKKLSSEKAIAFLNERIELYKKFLRDEDKPANVILNLFTWLMDKYSKEHLGINSASHEVYSTKIRDYINLFADFLSANNDVNILLGFLKYHSFTHQEYRLKTVEIMVACIKDNAQLQQVMDCFGVGHNDKVIELYEAHRKSMQLARSQSMLFNRAARNNPAEGASAPSEELLRAYYAPPKPPGGNG